MGHIIVYLVFMFHPVGGEVETVMLPVNSSVLCNKMGDIIDKTYDKSVKWSCMSRPV